MEKLHFETRTSDTFVAVDGRTVRYQDVFDGIAAYLYTYAASRGKGLSNEQLREVFQEAACKAVRSHSTYDPALSSPRTFGSRIAENCVRDAFTKSVRRNSVFVPFVYQDEDGEDYVPASIDGYRGDEYEADRDLRTREAMERIDGAVSRLGETQQKVIRLAGEGLKPRNMAPLLNKTPGAVWTVLCRARQAFRSELDGDLGEYGIGA